MMQSIRHGIQLTKDRHLLLQNTFAEVKEEEKCVIIDNRVIKNRGFKKYLLYFCITYVILYKYV